MALIEDLKNLPDGPLKGAILELCDQFSGDDVDGYEWRWREGITTTDDVVEMDRAHKLILAAQFISKVNDRTAEDWPFP
jgi:hypothetical protein